MPLTFGNGLNLVTLIFQFRSRFPEFDTVADGDVATAFGDAGLLVDPSIWSKGDYGPGLLYLTAHFVALKQIVLAAAAEGGTGALDLYVASIGIGERRVMFRQRKETAKADAMVGPGESVLMETYYGSQFLYLRARNISAIVVV